MRSSNKRIRSYTSSDILGSIKYNYKTVKYNYETVKYNNETVKYNYITIKL